MIRKLHSILLTLLLFLVFSSLAGCGNENPSREISVDNNQTPQDSLFKSDNPSDKTARFRYQSVYPGESVDTDSLLIGLDAAMSGDFSRSGVSIWRGMTLAVDEINADGGLLGRDLQIVVKDHRANPARGVENIRQFSTRDRMLAVMGGMHTPVLLKELPEIHKNQMISLVPWAAGTPIIDNGFDPNYVFRLSVRDEYAGPYLVDKLVDAGYERPALFLEKTGWGRSNRKALTAALEQQDLSPASIHWFNWSEKSFRQEITKANKNGADIIVFVGNAPEGATLVNSMADKDSSKRLPILSHWGITGGEFFRETRSALRKVQLRVLQTRSFLNPANPEHANREIQHYCDMFPCTSRDGSDIVASDIVAPVGTAHAHDLVNLLGQAVRKANSTRRSEIRDALEQLDPWTGIVRDYERPFTPSNHEALTIDDLRLARYDTTGALVLEDLE